MKCSDMPESKKIRNENAVARLNPRKPDKKNAAHRAPPQSINPSLMLP